jgi:hypothetical protein
VQDLDREVLPQAAEYFLLLLLENLAGAVVRVDDLVTDLVSDRGAAVDGYFLILLGRRGL